MPSTTVIVLDANPPPPRELLAALEAMDAAVVARTLSELLTGPVDVLPVADVLLAPAEVPGDSVRTVVRRLRRWAGAPIVVVWTVDGFAALEEHVRIGHDYLVPPSCPPWCRPGCTPARSAPNSAAPCAKPTPAPNS